MLYNLSRRAPEFELFPICQELNIPIMAYSPIEQGRILGNPVLRDIAARHDASPVQIALAWVLLQTAFAPSRGQAYENRAALEIRLDRDDLVAQARLVHGGAFPAGHAPPGVWPGAPPPQGSAPGRARRIPPGCAAGRFPGRCPRGWHKGSDGTGVTAALGA